MGRNFKKIHIAALQPGPFIPGYAIFHNDHQRQIIINSIIIPLTKIEYLLIKALLVRMSEGCLKKASDPVLSIDELMQMLAEYLNIPMSKASEQYLRKGVSKHLYNANRKFQSIGIQIPSVPRRGYMFFFPAPEPTVGCVAMDT